MKNHRLVAVVCLLYLINGLTGFISVEAISNGATSPMNGYGDYPPPGSGDWTITGDTYVGNETIILNGNLIIQSGALLTLRNVTLRINSTASLEYAIEVLSGGALRVLDLDSNNITTGDASRILRNNVSYAYFFRAYEGSTLEIRNSIISRCGRISAIISREGLYVATDDAVVDHCQINNSIRGIILYGSDGVVSNNTIDWNGQGVVCTAWSNATIENNYIAWSQPYGIYINGVSNVKNWGSNPFIINNTIYKTGRDGINQGDALQIEYSSHPVFINNKVIDWGEDGLFIFYKCSLYAESLLLQPDGGNFCIAGAGGLNWVRLTNSTLLSSVNFDVALTGTYVIFTNTTYDNADVAFGDTISNFTARWFLNTYINDTNGDPVPGANIRIRDNANGTYDENFTTDANGNVNWTVLTEYYQNKSTKISYTSHNITVSKPGYLDADTEIEMNQSKYITITLGDAGAPNHSNEIPLPDSFRDAPGTNVSVHVTDPSGINESTIQLWINGSLVVHTITPITGGYNVSWISGGFDPGVIECRIVVDDNCSNTLDYYWNFTVLALYEIQLQGGWNLISLPLEQVDTSIPSVLTSISGQWNVVKYYDNTDKNDPWKTYRPGASTNDLAGIDNTMGFWINITEPNVNVTVRGNITSSTSISLYAGWNLVGYPSQTTETVANALWGTGADRVEVCNISEPYLIKEVGPTYIMKPGEGYWVHVPADSVWTINW